MKTLSVVMAVAGLLLCSVPATADPVEIYQWEDEIQDDWLLGTCVEELSILPHHPGELIEAWQVDWIGHIPCPEEYQGGPCVQVAIANCTNRCFEELYYVGDSHDWGLETTFTNYDEWIGDMNGATVNPGWPNPGMAFKIDAVGENTPLVMESITPDGCFEPGEVWEFIVQEYSNLMGLPPSALGSVSRDGFHGAIAEASWLGEDQDLWSSASIIALEHLIPGDADADWDVDADDLEIVARHWGWTTATGRWQGDFDGDGFVGPRDASILAAQWGGPYPCSEAANGVPEPAAAVLLLGIALAVAARRPR